MEFGGCELGVGGNVVVDVEVVDYFGEGNVVNVFIVLRMFVECGSDERVVDGVFGLLGGDGVGFGFVSGLVRGCLGFGELVVVSVMKFLIGIKVILEWL